MHGLLQMHREVVCNMLLEVPFLLVNLRGVVFVYNSSRNLCLRHLKMITLRDNFPLGLTFQNHLSYAPRVKSVRNYLISDQSPLYGFSSLFSPSIFAITLSTRDFFNVFEDTPLKYRYIYLELDL